MCALEKNVHSCHLGMESSINTKYVLCSNVSFFFLVGITLQLTDPPGQGQSYLLFTNGHWPHCVFGGVSTASLLGSARKGQGHVHGFAPAVLFEIAHFSLSALLGWVGQGRQVHDLLASPNC